MRLSRTFFSSVHISCKQSSLFINLFRIVRLVETWKKDVARVFCVDFGKIKEVRKRERFFVEPPSPCDKNVGKAASERSADSRLKRADGKTVFRAKIFCSRNNDIQSVGKRFADFFKGLSSHNDRISRRQCTKTGAFDRNIPRNFSAVPDNAPHFCKRRNHSNHTLSPVHPITHYALPITHYKVPIPNCAVLPAFTRRVQPVRRKLLRRHTRFAVPHRDFETHRFVPADEQDRT